MCLEIWNREIDTWEYSSKYKITLWLVKVAICEGGQKERYNRRILEIPYS